MAEDQPIDLIGKPQREASDLRDLISFQIHRLSIANDRHGQRLIMDRFGVSLPQWRVIGVIGALGPDAPIADVLDELSMNKSQLSRELKILLELGLVTTSTDAVDRRRLRAALTGAGQTLHDRIIVYVRAENETMLSQLSPEARRTLMESLEALIAWTETDLTRLERS